MDDLADPSSIAALPPPTKYATLDSLGAALSSALDASSSALNTTSSRLRRLAGRRLAAGDVRPAVAESVSGTMDKLSVGALAGTIAGESWRMSTPTIHMLAAREDLTTLPGHSLHLGATGADAGAGVGGTVGLGGVRPASTAGFVLPRSAVEMARAQALNSSSYGVTTLDVQLVQFGAASNPRTSEGFSWHRHSGGALPHVLACSGLGCMDAQSTSLINPSKSQS